MLLSSNTRIFGAQLFSLCQLQRYGFCGFSRLTVVPLELVCDTSRSITEAIMEI